MIMQMLLVPSLLLIVGLALVACAILAPARELDVRSRIRTLERLPQGPAAATALVRALDDPSVEVAAVAAVLLRDAGRDDLLHASRRTEEVRALVPLWRR
jgi:hypothetical protein